MAAKMKWDVLELLWRYCCLAQWTFLCLLFFLANSCGADSGRYDEQTSLKCAAVFSVTTLEYASSSTVYPLGHRIGRLSKEQFKRLLQCIPGGQTCIVTDIDQCQMTSPTDHRSASKHKLNQADRTYVCLKLVTARSNSTTLVCNHVTLPVTRDSTMKEDCHLFHRVLFHEGASHSADVIAQLSAHQYFHVHYRPCLAKNGICATYVYVYLCTVPELHSATTDMTFTQSGNITEPGEREKLQCPASMLSDAHHVATEPKNATVQYTSADHKNSCFLVSALSISTLVVVVVAVGLVVYCWKKSQMSVSHRSSNTAADGYTFVDIDLDPKTLSHNSASEHKPIICSSILQAGHYNFVHRRAQCPGDAYAKLHINPRSFQHPYESLSSVSANVAQSSDTSNESSVSANVTQSSDTSNDDDTSCLLAKKSLSVFRDCHNLADIKPRLTSALLTKLKTENSNAFNNTNVEIVDVRQSGTKNSAQFQLSSQCKKGQADITEPNEKTTGHKVQLATVRKLRGTVSNIYFELEKLD